MLAAAVTGNPKVPHQHGAVGKSCQEGCGSLSRDPCGRLGDAVRLVRVRQKVDLNKAADEIHGCMGGFEDGLAP